MSYLVLARKWRPQNFHQVVGQEHVTATLANAIAAGRLAHAFLFSGPRGVGKTSVARIVAKAINCQEEPGKRPCNRCLPCKEITRGAAVDVVEIDGASNRGIDEIRQLRENVLFRPTLLSSKVYIIDEVHMLTKEAFNALLKTLEEPPDHVYFIFATTEPNKVPATIKSRCQHYEFKRVPTPLLTDHLLHILHEEGLRWDRKMAELVATEADGSVRDALSLLDQLIAYGANEYDEVCSILGVTGAAHLEGLVEALLARETSTVLQVLDEAYQRGSDMARLLSGVIMRLRARLMVKALGWEKGAKLCGLDPEEGRRMERSLEDISMDQLTLLLRELVDAQPLVVRSELPRLQLELLFLRLCAMGEVVEIDRVIEALREGGEGREVKARRPEDAPQQGAAASRPKQKASISPPQADSWPRFVEFVASQAPHLSPLLEKSNANLEGDRVDIEAANSFHFKMLSQEERLQELTALAKRFFKRDLELRVVSNGRKEVDTQPVADRTHDDSASAKASLADMPLVQEAMRIFGANIREIRLDRE